MSSPLDQIHELIPHRDPFLFVDDILEQDESRILCRKTFSGEEFFFGGHYPHFPLVPGVILCEAIMQAGALLVAKTLPENEKEGKLPVVAKMGEVRFKQMVRPGNTILLEARFKEKMGTFYFLHGKAKLGGKTILQFEFACVLTDKTTD